MLKNRKKVWKVFWAWQDEAEEVWLREMSNEGWKLVAFNFFVYTFEECEPKDVIYKLDYKSTWNKDKAEYLTIFSDAGWEHVTEFMNWHYFRVDALNCIIPDIYSDTNSKIQKYKGLLTTILIITACTWPSMLNIILNPAYHQYSGSGLSFMNIIRALLVLELVFFLYCIIRLVFKIRQLKQGQ